MVVSVSVATPDFFVVLAIYILIRGRIPVSVKIVILRVDFTVVRGPTVAASSLMALWTLILRALYQ